MCKFSSSQKLASLCVIAISIGVLLALNFLAEAEVNSPTLTILDVEEMSHIAGGQAYCYRIGSSGGGSSGSCRPSGSSCVSGSQCGSNPYTVRYASQYCYNTVSGYDSCSCTSTIPGWVMYNCQRCTWFSCSRSYIGSGGSRNTCWASGTC